MHLARILNGFSLLLCCALLVSADAVNVTSSYLGSSLDPGPGYTNSPNSSYSFSNTITEQGKSTTLNISESASETPTTASLQTSNALTPYSFDGPGEYSTIVSAVFSGVEVSVTQPVYLSESVTVSYNYQTDFSKYSNGQDVAAYDSYLQLFDSANHQIGGCTINPAFFAVAGSGTQKCSSGKILISRPSDITINNDLSVTNSVYLSGDSVSFSGTSTLSQLLVYNLDGDLIETLNLNNTPVTATPEPSSILFAATGFATCLVSRCHKHFASARLRSNAETIMPPFSS